MIRVVICSIIIGAIALGYPAGAQEQAGQKKSEKEEPFVYTTEDLPSVSDRSVSTPVQTGTVEKPVPVLPSYAEYRDKNDHGEGWWRNRVASLDYQIYQAAVSEQEIYVTVMRGRGLGDPRLRKVLHEATNYLKDLEAEREGLPEELRVAGGLAGWLRRGEYTVSDKLLSPPVQNEPANTDTVEFSWEAVPGASFYFLEVECYGQFSLLDHDGSVFRDVAVTSTEFRFGSDCAGRWRICSLDDYGRAGDWSSWSSFEFARPVESRTAKGAQGP